MECVPRAPAGMGGNCKSPGYACADQVSRCTTACALPCLGRLPCARSTTAAAPPGPPADKPHSGALLSQQYPGYTCPGGSLCVSVNPWYHQCQPDYNLGERALPAALQAPRVLPQAHWRTYSLPCRHCCSHAHQEPAARRQALQPAAPPAPAGQAAGQQAAHPAPAAPEARLQAAAPAAAASPRARAGLAVRRHRRHVQGPGQLVRGWRLPGALRLPLRAGVLQVERCVLAVQGHQPRHGPLVGRG
jgi:hypothetical protein